MKSRVLLALGAAVLSASPALAADPVWNFGMLGWYSSDTRDAAGVNLFGLNSTSPVLNAAHGGAVAGDDAKIANQITFMAGPAGALDGSVRLYATNQNAGKANLSVMNTTNGFGTGTDLLAQSFYISYRYYNEPVTTTRTPAVGVSLTDGAGSYYTFSHIDPTNTAFAWNDDLANATSNWALYGNGALGAAPGGTVTKTMADWAADPTFGSVMTSSFGIYEMGFNLGSYQRNNYTYFDWYQSNLVNGGVMVNFVPEPASLILLAIGGAGCLAGRARRRAR